MRNGQFSLTKRFSRRHGRSSCKSGLRTCFGVPGTVFSSPRNWEGLVIVLRPLSCFANADFDFRREECSGVCVPTTLAAHSARLLGV